MKGAFLVCENPNEEFDIKCEIRQDLQNEIPEEQNQLYLEVEKTCNIIKALENTDEAVKRKYFDKLLSLAQVGLVPENAQTKSAALSMERLKEEILLVEGKRIKNTYMIYLGIAAILIAAVLGIVSGIAYGRTQIPGILCIYLAVLGALAGTWVSFGARKFEITFEDLASLEKDRMNPIIRLIYISITAVIVLLFLNVGILEVRLGNLDTAKTLTDLKSAFIVGTVCGLVESKIGVKVYDKAKMVTGEE